MALKADLVSLYPLNEASGTRVDAHGPNDLADNNTVGSATGKLGNAADFEETAAEHLSITHESQVGLGLTGDFTLMCWIKKESTGLYGYPLLTKYLTTGNQRQYYWQFNHDGTDGFELSVSQDGGTGNFRKFIASQSLTNGVWYHCAVTFDLSAISAKFYLDGVLLSGSTATSNGTLTGVHAGSGNFEIGTREGDRVYNIFDGLIDQAAVWSRVLSLEEIEEIYNSGDGLAYADWDGGGGGATFIPKVSMID